MEGARPARVDDLPRLVELIESAVDELRSERGGSLLLAGHDPGAVAGAVGALLERPDTSTWCGTVADVPVGVAAGRTVDRGDQRIGRVELIYVEPDARGVGVGEAMLGGLTGWFCDQGCGGMDAVALPGSRMAKQFFEGNGLVARLIVMHRRLP